MALQTIGMKPHLVQNIFADMQFSEPRKGFYVLRLYKHCQWMHILLDDAFPADEEGNALWATSEFELCQMVFQGLLGRFSGESREPRAS